MDVDAEIDRWRNQSCRGSYSSYFRRQSRDAYSTHYDSPSRRYVNNDFTSAYAAASHRRVPPPPPPPLPPPPPTPSDSRRHVETGKKRAKRAATKQNSSKRRDRSATSSSSSAASSTATKTRAASSKSSGAASSTDTSSSGSYTSASEASTSTSSSTSSSSAGTDTSDTNSGSASSDTSSTYSSSSADSHCHHRHHHYARHGVRKQMLSKSVQAALIRVAQHPGRTPQDEEIAAAAACCAILEKETALKEKELRLLQQKKEFAAEVQRRSSLPRRFSGEDEALRQLQRLVDLEDPSPSLEDYLKRTASTTKATITPPLAIAENAPTDAGALAYLQSYEPAEWSTLMPSVNQVGAAAGEPPIAATATDERTAVVTDDTPTSVKADGAARGGSTANIPAAVVPAGSSSVTKRTSLRPASAIGSNYSLEHTLPLDVHLLSRPGGGTPTKRTDILSPVDPREATAEKKSEEDSDAAPAETIGADHTEEKQVLPLTTSTVSATLEALPSSISPTGTSANGRSAPASPSRVATKPAEDHHQHSGNNGGSGGGRIIHIEIPRRLVKVKVRRRRSQSRSNARAAHTDSEDEMDEEGEIGKDGRRFSLGKDKRSSQKGRTTPPCERRNSSSHSYLTSPSAPSAQPLSVADAPPRQLLPPPPSPAADGTSYQPTFIVAPLQQFNPSAAGRQQKQPWSTANWPCGTSRSGSSAGVAGTGGPNQKDASTVMWYASNSTVPLSQHEFKTLLCSEYNPPETAYAVSPEDEKVRAATQYMIEDGRSPESTRKMKAAQPPTSTGYTPEWPRTGRELYEPYEDAGSPGGKEGMRKTALSMNTPAEKRRALPQRRSVRVCGLAEEAAKEDIAVEERRGKAAAPGKRKGREKGKATGGRASVHTSGEKYSPNVSETEDDTHALFLPPSSTPPPPPAPVYAEDGESVVEFPPPPHLMATDMPPPGDVGGDSEYSCGGSCCSCWDRLFRFLFPCCCGLNGHKKNSAAMQPEPERPLVFQRPQSTPPTQRSWSAQVSQQGPLNGGAAQHYPNSCASPSQQQTQGPPFAQVQGSPLPPTTPQSAQPFQSSAPLTPPVTSNVIAPTSQATPQSTVGGGAAGYQSGGTGNILVGSTENSTGRTA